MVSDRGLGASGKSKTLVQTLVMYKDRYSTSERMEMFASVHRLLFGDNRLLRFRNTLVY